MELHLKIAGGLMISLALVHVIFPRYFQWSTELKPLSLINREMMYVHTFFVAFILLLMGALCLTSARDLVETELGKRVCFGIGIFWFARLVVQFFGYSAELWRGKRFETVVHILFAATWIYFSGVFLAVYIN